MKKVFRDLKKRRRKKEEEESKQRYFRTQYGALKQQETQTERRFLLAEQDLFPQLNDRTETTNFDRHYVYHTSWAARVLKETNPQLHVDISSTLYFCGILSTFIRMDYYDYRPAELYLSNLESKKADLVNLHFDDNSISSLSCMHTVEHVGLGRYGDPLDYDGDIKAINELSRVLSPGGDLLFVVPVGREAKIMFNAHRIYTKELVIRLFQSLNLHSFTLIPQQSSDGGLVEDPSDELLQRQVYGCGCFWFKK
jgi:hypothetical protein